MYKSGFTLVEMLVTTAITIILLIGLFNFYYVSKVVYTSGITRQALQNASGVVLSKIIQGGKEQPSGGVYRLAQGTRYCIGTGASCGGAVSTAELHYWGPDNIERWYRLGGANTSLIYHHPIAGNAAGADETIYTAPSGATLTLLFWIPSGNYPAANAGASVTLTQIVYGKTFTGSSTTVVNLRNHP